MSRLKLPDFFHKRGMVAIVSLLTAFTIIIAGTYAWVSLVQRATNQFEYEPYEPYDPSGASFRISKTIHDKDINGNAYSAANKYDPEKDRKFPFEFTVIIGDSESTLNNEAYDYVIVDTSDVNEPIIPDYHYTEDGADIYVTGRGKIASGGTIYLRDGEKAVVYGIPTDTYYLVQEKNYIEADYVDGFDPNSFDFGCSNLTQEDGEYKHSVIARVLKEGWISLGDKTTGTIQADGSSQASFINVRVPEDYEITISSLVVVDRIVEDDSGFRLEAGQEIIDYAQPFTVRVTIGGDSRQHYYYEVVHIEEAEKQLEDYEEKDDYYHANDPHSDWHLNNSDTPLLSVSKARLFNLNSLQSGFMSILPPYLAGGQGLIPPLHVPSDYERRLPGTRTYNKELKVSDGNVITVDLHHQSAVIIYGIPTLTPYIAEQVENINGIYALHSTFNDNGVIMPDLNAIDDPLYQQYSTFSMNSARASARSDPTPPLWRTRADIFNHPPNGVKTVEVEKVWRGGNSSTQPAGVNVDIINAADGAKATSITLPKNNIWSASAKVPATDGDGNEIFYNAVEAPVKGYTSKVVKTKNNSFTITNTYNSGSSGDEDSDESVTAEKSTLTITKTIKGNVAERYKRFDFTVIIGRFKYKITLADGEKYTFTDIPVGTKYSVTEAAYTQEGYTTTSTGSSGTISNGGNTAAFVNTKDVVSQSGSGSLTVTKTISGRFVDTTKNFRFSAQIGQDRHTFTLRNGESKTFTDIPEGTAYTVKEDDYSSQNYVSSSTNSSGTVTSSGATAAFVNEYIGDALPEPGADAVQISGTKTWEHGSNTEPPQSIQIFVMNGSEIVTKKTVTAQENWQYAFRLPRCDAQGKEITYSINEEPVKKYIKSINGYDITNTYDPRQNPETGGGRAMWIWFIVLAAGSLGLRMTVFYRNRKKGTD